MTKQHNTAEICEVIQLQLELRRPLLPADMLNEGVGPRRIIQIGPNCDVTLLLWIEKGEEVIISEHLELNPKEVQGTVL